DTRVCGVPIPGHRSFPEVNLRLYVVRQCGDQQRRGVVFVRELVPRWAVAFVARACYEERYWTVPLRYEQSPSGEPIAAGTELGFRWKFANRWHSMRARLAGSFREPMADSHEAFIAEHYWAYTALRRGATAEYQVEHVPWRVAPVDNVALQADVAALYGPQFVEALAAAPASAFVAEGSPILVRWGARLRDDVPGRDIVESETPQGRPTAIAR
ncbi:MAG: DUF2071 domain-containing protein, partial [Pirellulales bacterium]